MGFFELLLIAVGLSMDAFAVSICKGLSLKKLSPRHAALVGLYFGSFQFLMLCCSRQKSLTEIICLTSRRLLNRRADARLQKLL